MFWIPYVIRVCYVCLDSGPWIRSREVIENADIKKNRNKEGCGW